MDTKQARTLLEEELSELTETERELDAEHDRDAGNEPTTARQHPADHAAEVSTESAEQAFHTNLDQRVEQVEAALHRLDDGTYGVCARCGQRIPDERLEARPAAPFCVDCQQLMETA